MGEPAPRVPHGALSTWARLGAAFALLGVLASGVLVILLFLLPWRHLRLRTGGMLANFLGPKLLWILGIDLMVEGEIESTRPAVFLINHASSLDVPISMAVWPTFGCGISKREVIWVPFFGVAYALGGNLLIDRRNRVTAIAGIDRLVATVNRHGLSPWISPEGTRSLDGTLGPFKKGFVHIAIATGLPVVPVVFHGADALWPAKTFRLTPGTVRVQVLDAMPTSGWSVDTLDEHVASVRQVFAEALR
jgi:1-acyl-sn-glycerol-3-phosphate acyltransferase